MANFNYIKEIRLANETLYQTQQWLSKAGIKKNESFVLWAGKFITDEIFVVTSVIYPEQRAFKTLSGIGVLVPGDEMFKINKWLYENELVLISQVHSHPTQAYHSETDDAFPLVTAIGQFSIVVPNFAKSLIHLPSCAVYRLNSNKKWVEINKFKINEIFKVVE